MNKIKIGFDLDGVLYPWHRVVFDKLKRKGMANKISYEEFWYNEDGWNKLSDLIKRDLLTNQKYYKAEMASREVVKLLNDLSNNFVFYYITQRDKKLEGVTGMWVNKNNFPYPDNLFVNDDKVSVIRELKLNLYIEDRLDLYNKIINTSTKCLLIKHPWNDYGKGINLSFDNTKQAIEYVINELDRTNKYVLSW